METIKRIIKALTLLAYAYTKKTYWFFSLRINKIGANPTMKNNINQLINPKTKNK